MADVPSSSDYTVMANAGGINVGEYSVTLKLADSENTSWDDGADGDERIITWQILPASVGGGTEEPGAGTVPVGGNSKFDTSSTYDGLGHTIDTNALVAAFAAAIVGDATVEYALDNGSDAPALPWVQTTTAFTNAGEYVVWYKVANPNYDDFVHKAKVTIAKRSVTLTSGSDRKGYDGTALVKHEVIASGDGFADGEGATYSYTGSQNSVGESANTFVYSLNDGTESDNYEIAVINGTLTVTKPLALRCEWGSGVVPPESMDLTILTNGASWRVVTLLAAENWEKTVADYVYGAGIAYTISPASPDGIVSAVECYGCKRLGNVTLKNEVLSRTGWLELGSANSYTEVYTPKGWRNMGTIKLGELVAVQNFNEGLLFRVDNDKMSVVPVNDGTGGSGGADSAFSYLGVYDGEGHGIDVALDDMLIGVAIKYVAGNSTAMPDSGWTSTNPLFTNICNTTYVWYAVECPGYLSYTNCATVTITPRNATLTSADGNWTYDGLAHSNVTVTAAGFVDGEGVTTNGFATITDVGSVPNAFGYDFTAGTLAANYNVSCVTGTLTVTKATIGPGGGGGGEPEEPGSGTVPVGGNSKFDTSSTYDGLGHTIDTNALVAAFAAAIVGDATVEYALDNGSDAPALPWMPTAPAFTNAGEYVVWYKVTNPNYDDFTHSAKVTIGKRDATLTSADGNWTYDGLAHSNIIVAATGFVDGEGVTTNGFATITDVGTIPNAFGYDFADGTLAANYNVACVTGMLTVTKAAIGHGGGGGGEPEEPGSGTIPVGGNSKFDTSSTYDGLGHTIDTNALVAAFAAAIVGDATVEYALDNGSDAPALPWVQTTTAFTNAGEYIVWYCVTSPNYDDFVHKAKVTIAKRDATLTSADGNWTYDGIAHSNATVTAAGFVDGEGVTTNGFATITDVGSVPNAFDYAFAVGTLAANYNVSCVTGTLTITSSPDTMVVLDALGGKIGGVPVVTQECAAVYGALPAATRENYVFDGWFLGVTNGAPQATSGGALLVDADHALFARWSVDETSIPGGVAPTFAVEAIDGGTCRITGLGGMTGTKLVIPDYIGGLAVTEIAMGAFANLTNGLAEVVLPSFCMNIGDLAFLSIKTLTSVTFANARKWNAPSEPAAVRIGSYAFAGTALVSVVLPDCVAAIDDYAFANCQTLSSMTILGHPSIGLMPFRRSGYGTPGGVEVHLDPTLAGDDDFMDALKQECEKVTVRTDAVVSRVAMASLSMGSRKVRLTVSVERASSWGEVDAGSVRVNYRTNIGDAPTPLVPDSVTENPDGSLTVEVSAPEGPSGFFQAVIE